MNIAAEQTTKLILDLQSCAHNAGHPVPLAIALDQENGGVNSLFDERFIRQFPSAMGVAATGSTDMAYEIAKATGQELGSVGINWIMGPVLDVLTNVKNQPLGVRTSGDDAEEVSKYGLAFMRGYKDAGIATCGKHFPSYGNLEFLGSSLDVPIITDSLESLSFSALVPFRNAIQAGVDAMFVGGCAMSSAGVNAMHACLSEQVCDDLLRQDFGFGGVVVSECLEMEALSKNIGIGGGTVMAINAGCDMVLCCRLYSAQKEAISGLKTGLANGVITQDRVRESIRRIMQMKARCTSWDKALSPGGVGRLASLTPVHTKLSERAYNNSITLVRDKNNLLPLTNVLEPDEEVLLMTPLVKPLPASAAARSMSVTSPGPNTTTQGSPGMSGEAIFREFGRSLARQRNGRVLHTSYTANGVRPMHENLINRASAVVVLTADANRNLYQHGFTKHVAMICKTQLDQDGEMREKPLIVVSVSSPYDFAMDPSIGTYVCTYDFTETALQALTDVLFGGLTPLGSIPGSVNQHHKAKRSKHHWLVESFDEERDTQPLNALLTILQGEVPITQKSEFSGCTASTFLLRNSSIEEHHGVVRNSSTNEVLGFCSSYYFTSTGTGVLGCIMVNPDRRKLSMGHSLHNRAVRLLLQKPGIRRLQLGSRLPSVYLGLPSNSNVERKRLRQWFASMGWKMAVSRPVCSMMLKNLRSWKAPETIARSLQSEDIDFDLIHGWEHAASVLDHIQSTSRQGITEIYQLALADEENCGVIRAKRRIDGAIVGTVVLYKTGFSWVDAVPLIKEMKEATGGISSPVISPGAGGYSTLLQGLILLAIRQIQKQQAHNVLLDCVSPL